VTLTNRRTFSIGMLGLMLLGCTSARDRSQRTSAKVPSARPATGASQISSQASSAATNLSHSASPAPRLTPQVASPAVVYLAPLGSDFKSEDLAFIARTVEIFYRVTCKSLDAMPLPKAAFYPARNRYRAEKLLDALYEHRPPDAHVIIGLTTVDISTTKGDHADWGILGLATVSGGECVISKFRAQKSARDEHHTRQRLAKTVVHEVGHTLGLRHCPNFGCLMEDGQGTVLTTDHEYDLCAACRTALGSWAVELPSDGPPWPRPAPG